MYELKTRKLPNKKYIAYIKDNKTGKNIYSKLINWPAQPWALKQLVDRMNRRMK